MAFMIDDGCISCGACEPVCPNAGIRRDAKRLIYVIDSSSCTECVGFFNTQRCVEVCPVSCCLRDPNHVQTEAVLFERAKAIHADSNKQPTLTAETSHFQTAAPGKWWERLFRSVRNTAPANAEA